MRASLPPTPKCAPFEFCCVLPEAQLLHVPSYCAGAPPITPYCGGGVQYIGFLEGEIWPLSLPEYHRALSKRLQRKRKRLHSVMLWCISQSIWRGLYDAFPLFCKTAFASIWKYIFRYTGLLYYIGCAIRIVESAQLPLVQRASCNYQRPS